MGTVVDLLVCEGSGASGGVVVNENCLAVSVFCIQFING